MNYPVRFLSATKSFQRDSRFPVPSDSAWHYPQRFFKGQPFIQAALLQFLLTAFPIRIDKIIQKSSFQRAAAERWSQNYSPQNSSFSQSPAGAANNAPTCPARQSRI